ncbi:hypothetical protein FISHEDRAFT_41591 [Fistulina hepatica ATCC 64428]|nr:hypothetical protein FISHEDRAFT_41591 [Fistulina hepatica ATCC 64428]
MEPVAGDPDAQTVIEPHEDIPANLERATMRMQFPPSYVIVGVYRLLNDPQLRKPTWDKCKHATRRGLIVGFAWAALTFGIQKKFIEVFLTNSPRITGLSNDTMFGFRLPFSVQTYAAVLMLGSQVTYIMRFFLARNINIARERAWNYTVISRGKGPGFWHAYVEESEGPASVEPKRGNILHKMMGTSFGRFFVKRVIFLPFNLYPFVGIAVTAWFKALGTARYLHKPYFESKKMTKEQIQTFVERHKWDYRAFGFAAALLEGVPIIGLLFTVSNRVGAAMWAHDLEKRQHFIEERKQK